ncbi:hypothetical protein [Burkholderia gladioli]|uniref:hypothetical protein n=1 Tax=Burkholderia gladioli TaxID=28095 RepID=UPI001FC81EFF|nr:hypothetical protein [Burkholderia gladioli]MDN7726523.1 hypothetical protein [Burkholderia gladioli]
MRARIARLHSLATMYGRRVRFDLSVHVIVRDSEGAAWARADELLHGISEGIYTKAQRALDAYDSVAQPSQTALSRRGPRSLRELEVYPNLSAGVGLKRGARAQPPSAATTRSRSAWTNSARSALK